MVQGNEERNGVPPALMKFGLTFGVGEQTRDGRSDGRDREGMSITPVYASSPSGADGG